MRSNLPPAIIFDMDDTILADDKALETCWRQVCQGQAHRIAACSTEELLAEIQNIHRWFLADPGPESQVRHGCATGTLRNPFQGF